MPDRDFERRLNRRFKTLSNVFGLNLSFRVECDSEPCIKSTKRMADGKKVAIVVGMPAPDEHSSEDDIAFQSLNAFMSVHCQLTTKPLTRQKYPQLVEAYEQLCLLNGISPMPKLCYTTSPFASCIANTVAQTIIIGPDILHSPIEEVLGVISHEIGHFLERAYIPQEGVVVTRWPKQDMEENAADRISARMMYDPKPLMRALTRYYEARDVRIDAMLQDANPDMRDIGAWLKDRVERLQASHYGTLEERLGRLTRADIGSRIRMDVLTAKRRQSWQEHISTCAEQAQGPSVSAR